MPGCPVALNALPAAVVPARSSAVPYP